MEFTLNGVEYRAAKLSVFDQLKVCRKLLPVLSSVVSDLSTLRGAAEKTANDSREVDRIINVILPKIADVVADMPDESVDAILHPCLKVVSRKSAVGNWTSIFSDGQLMFEDIDLFTMLSIAGRVVADNLGNFLHELPASATPTPSAD
ncbi:phage tail assembly chaperone [Pectobacterium versatile]|uniref:phage tail assembly chaperone n=1 Tax=Pectobacterium versatile TaxID=2488639 RepID=UPI003803BFF7